MNLLPYKQFQISSPLKRQDALAALDAHLEPAKFFRTRWPNPANDKRFEGVAGDSGFRIQRVLGYNNVFAPKSTGVVEPVSAGSQILVTMRPQTRALVFYGAILTLGAAGVLIAGGYIWMILLLVAMLCTMVWCGFWYEAGKQERTLREIFRAL